MTARELDRRFDLHKPATPGDGVRCDEIRKAIKTAAVTIAAHTYANREQSLAIGKLEEALFFAIGAVVRPPVEF